MEHITDTAGPDYGNAQDKSMNPGADNSLGTTEAISLDNSYSQEEVQHVEGSLHLKYLVINPYDLLWGMAVNSVGFQEIGPGMPYPPANHPSRYLFSAEKGRILNEYQLIYITKGKGYFTSASLGHKVPVTKGTMFLLFPGEWHTYYPDPDTGWKEFWIGFSGNHMDHWLSNGFFSKSKPIYSVGLHNDMVELYDKAIKTAMDQESGFQQLLSSIVSHLLGLAYFYEKNQAYRSSEIGDQINRAKIMIMEQFRTIKPEEIAKTLCMGYSNFRKVFKEYTGFSPAKYIQEVKFSKTKEELTNSSLSIKEIAYAMGYDNYEYFFTAFRRQSGMTPAEYRAVTQGKDL